MVLINLESMPSFIIRAFRGILIFFFNDSAVSDTANFTYGRYLLQDEYIPRTVTVTFPVKVCEWPFRVQLTLLTDQTCHNVLGPCSLLIVQFSCIIRYNSRLSETTTRTLTGIVESRNTFLTY